MPGQGFPLTFIFPYKDKIQSIIDSVLILKNTGQWKNNFWRVLRSGWDFSLRKHLKHLSSYLDVVTGNCSLKKVFWKI